MKYATIFDALQGLRFQFLKWRIRNVSKRNFLLGLSVLTGLVCGFAAILLKNLVHFIQDYLQYRVQFPYHTTLYFIFPMLGILLTALLVKRLLKGQLGRGLSPIIENIARKGSKIEQHKTWSHVLTSGVTAGFGGSAGLEAPIVVTGSAIGSNLGILAHLNYRERTLLLGCGAAAGISAVFNCPIAGVIFAFEVLLEGFSVPAFIPLLLSSATAAVVSRFFFADRLFYLITDNWTVSQLPFYTLLGLACGLVSVYMTRSTLLIEGRFKRWKSHYRKALGGGALLGGLIFLLPTLYGEGYTLIQALLNGEYALLLRNSLFGEMGDGGMMLILLAGATVLMKVVATSLTIASGGNGGIFAPSLFTGSLLGFTFSFGLNSTGMVALPIASFVATAMAGVLSGVVHAPLTGIFLIAEITGGYNLFVPLMIVSASAFFVSRLLEPYSVYTNRLARKGIVGTHQKDSAVMRAIRLKKLIRKPEYTLRQDMPLGDLVKIVEQSHINHYPVIGADKQFLGMVELDRIRDLLFRVELYETKNVSEFMFFPSETIRWNDSAESAFHKFEKEGEECLPVLDGLQFKGFVFKSELLESYRHKLIRQSRELS